MLKQESKESVVTWTRRACDTCRSAASTLYYYCEADSAYLCTNCDARVHSANPIASQHQRVRVFESSPADNDEDDDQEVASWLLLDPGKNEFLFGVEYLDLMDYCTSMENHFEDQYSQYQSHRSFKGDGVVPLQAQGEESTSHNNFNYGYSSEAQISVVPESTTSDIAAHCPITPMVDQLPGPPIQQLTPMDREARVLRYREKKKTRKFEKTIRYASRKAYAEIRPRIKGRFAKQIETEAPDAEHLFSTSMISHTTGYGIVPSFLKS